MDIELYDVQHVRRILQKNQYQHTIIYKTLLRIAKIRFADLKRNSVEELRARAEYYIHMILSDDGKMKDFVLTINKKIVNKILCSISSLSTDDKISVLEILKKLSRNDRNKIYQCLYGDNNKIEDDILIKYLRVASE